MEAVRVFNQYVPANILLLFALESGFIALSFVLAAKLLFWNDPLALRVETLLPEFAWQAAISVVLLQVCFYCNDLYSVRTLSNRTELVLRVVQSVGIASLLLGFLFYMVPALVIGQAMLCVALLLVLGVGIVSRAVVISVPMTNIHTKVVIFGTTERARLIARELARRDNMGFSLEGFVAEKIDTEVEDLPFGKPLIRGLEELTRIVQTQGISRIVVATEDRRGSLPVQELVRIRMLGVRVEDAHSFVSSLTGRVWLDMVRPSWFLFSEGFRRSRFTEIWKRALDLLFAILGAIVSSPLVLLSALAILIESGRPIFYRQTRVGSRGKPFELIKLRSMRVDAEADGQARWAQENDTRTTRLGAFLRKYRLDELPQFINVIRGDMSFVGPRPERPVFVDQFREQIVYYDERHLIRPGITGWAQVQAPYGAGLKDTISKLEYDLFYLKNMSFSFDCAIIFATIRTVLIGRGAR
jgi:sugar transferase (PEP-CTERM system associated)